MSADDLKEIHAELEAKLAALTSSDDWTQALDVAAKFHKYSMSNVMWLMVQADKREIELSHVAGFRAWQKLGRQVRKGETALRVLAPSRYKVKADDGTDKWIIKGFTTACVFDISQTDGDEFPTVEPKLLIGDGSERALIERVIGIIETQGFTFGWASKAAMGGANGMTDHGTRTVQVRDDVTPAQALKTAVHELAHAQLHAPEDCAYRANRARLEVEAESVAYIVLNHLGVTSDEYSLPYVAQWSQGDAKAVRVTAETVIKTAHLVISAMTADTAAELVAA